ncbi:YJMC-like protein, partial [Mya arenaria]
MIQVFKIIHEVDDINASVFFNFADNSGTRGHCLKLAMPKAHKSIRLNSFGHRTISIWNGLPHNIVTCSTVNNMYVHDIQSGITVSDAEPKIVKETAATAFVNGNNVLGPVVGNLCMQTAIKKAKESGAQIIMVLLVAPAKNGDSFVLDMATSTVALGKVSTEPKSVLNGGGLMPLGGAEETGGYKGYGLAMMVEIFCGILSNASYGPNVRRWKNTDRIANLVEGEEEVLVAGDPEKQHMS